MSDLEDDYYLDPTDKSVGHVALCCVNHPDQRWSTKNIAPIGCRTIFYNLHGVPDAPIECACPTSDLRLIKNQEQQP